MPRSLGTSSDLVLGEWGPVEWGQQGERTVWWFLQTGCLGAESFRAAAWECRLSDVFS